MLGEGRSARSIAVELGLSEDALQRHAQRHRSRRAAPLLATAVSSSPPDDPLNELVTALRDEALSNNGNPAIVHQYRLALAAQADVKHAAPPQRDLALEAEWIELRSKMLAALEPFPEARLAIADALA